MGAIALTLRDIAMRTGRGVSAAAVTLVDGVTEVTVGDGGLVGSSRGVGGNSMGGGDGGKVSTERARVDAVSVRVAIDVEKYRQCCGLLATVCLREYKREWQEK